MRQSKKKKRSKVSGKGNASANQKEDKILKTLLEAFTHVSVEETASACREANGGPNKASEILACDVALEDQSTTCSSSNGTFDVGSSSSSNGNFEVGSSSSSNASMVLGDANDLLQHGMKQKNNKPKLKKVVASAGSVSMVLGRDYVRCSPMKGSNKWKGFNEESWREEAEQFLCSILEEDCELSLPVVGDILCQCGYNINKALDIVLELSGSSKEQASGYHKLTRKIIDRASDSTSHSSDIELQDNIWFTGNLYRNLSERNESQHPEKPGNLESELPQKVLECLFKMPTPKSAEHEPSNMNWRNVVKKMASLGPGSRLSTNEQVPPIHAKGDEYATHREAAQEHWKSMKSYYQRAATAFTNGEKEHAAYLSEKGRLQSKLAQEADQRASQDIFAARNKNIENMITIDLHGQHVKQAMKLLKLHLLFGAHVRSVRSFRVITGCGSHGLGKSKLKTSVVDLLKKEGIVWSEENRGTLLVRLEGQTNFNFPDSGSDSE